MLKSLQKIMISGKTLVGEKEVIPLNIMDKTSSKRKYNHFSGSTYYSLYDLKGNWVGYLSTSATSDWKDNQPSSGGVIVGEWNGVYYYGLGNSRMTFATYEESDDWAFMNMPDGNISILNGKYECQGQMKSESQ